MTINSQTRLDATRSDAPARCRSGAVIWLPAGLALGCLLFFEAAIPAQVNPTQSQKSSDSYLPVPDPKRIFRLESESHLTDRMIQDSKTGENPIEQKYTFVHPDYPAVTKEKYEFRRWEPLTELVEPPYVCYRRLYFEQINSERYGWDLGLGHPLLSAGIFFTDVALLPYHAFTEPFRRYECNAGYYLPGDPVPLMLYPPELNAPGLLAEAAVIGLCFAIFP
jgi:hypothetical protein